MNRVKDVNKVFLITILLYIVSGFINSFIYQETGSYNLVIVVSQVTLILPAVIYMAWKRMNIAEAIRFKGIRISNIVLLVIFAYLISPLMQLINGLSMIYVKNSTAAIMTEVTEENSIFLSLFLIAFIPAVFEEMVYRGLIYNTYRKETVVGGVLLSGFLFGIMHGNINQFSYAFVMGLIFALVIEATDSILSTMIIHLVINGSSFIMLYVAPMLLKLMEGLVGSELYSEANMAEAIAQVEEQLTVGFLLKTYGIPALVCTILAFIVYRVIAKNTGRWDYIKGIFKRKETGERKNLFTPYLILAILLCIALMVREEIFSARESTSSGIESSLILLKNWFYIFR